MLEVVVPGLLEELIAREDVAGVAHEGLHQGELLRGQIDLLVAAPDLAGAGIESEVADLKNIGSSYGGALTAGLFLQEFVDGAPWVHLDIAGPARANADDGYLSKGGTGFGVRTLIELARGYEAPKQ